MMDTEPVDDQYFTYHGRLASFQKSKKRGSTAKGSKALNWPHKKIAPEELARAGFYFQPWAENPDNVVCFLCHKSMDGWEEGDNPLLEHLKHSSSCGWAITAAIEAELEGYELIHPGEPRMVEARKETFAGRWPHDGKKGWLCKTKQLVESGWKYTPTPDSDDNATCAYCGLGLDGWEPKDKPYEEHHNRSPNCPFFLLSSQPNPSKKTARGKAARASKASRLSTQSVATVASEAPSMADTTIATTAAGDDTVLTTTSTMTPTSKKGRAKKSTASKRKTKAKKEEPAEAEEAPASEALETSPVAPPPARATRGKKRDSNAIDESTMTVVSEAPARKKRATRKGSVAVESSVLEPAEDEMLADAPAPKKTAGSKKGRGSTARTKEKVSSRTNTSMLSVASFQTLPGDFPDDDEIERQLEADLERPLTDDEDITLDSDSERNKAKTKAAKSKKNAQAKKSENFAMFDPSPAEPDDNDMEDELKALRAEMEVDEPEKAPEPEPEQLQVPKKGRKAGTRKVSKQTKPKKSKAAEPSPEEQVIPADPEPEPQPELEPELEVEPVPEVDLVPGRELEPEVEPEPEAELEAEAEAESEVEQQLEPEELADEHDASLGSTDTVVKTSDSERPVSQDRSRGRLSRDSFTSQSPTEADELAEDPVELHPVESTEPPKKRGRGRPSKASVASAASIQPIEKPVEPVEPPKKRGRGRPSKASQGIASGAAIQAKPADPPVKRSRGRPPKKLSVESKSEDAEAQLQEEAHAADMRAKEESKTLAAEPEIFDEEAGLSPVQESPRALSPPSRQFAQPPSTPAHGVSPSASARQAALSPSQSPQSSDAENAPPSSREGASATTKRVALAPMVATPIRSSPSKRNVLAGLQSKTPWKPLDLDAVLGTPFAGDGKENGVETLLRKGKELSSPEKRMTVEEWIYFNAGEAEKLLKHECEAMVSRFESEGTKAMNVLEGLQVE